MAVDVDTTDSTNATAQVVPAQRVRDVAIATGNPYGARAAGVTAPRLRTDQRGLHYEQRQGAQGVEFRFVRGELQLTLFQDVYVSDELTECERRFFDEHEQRHVRDNRRILGEMPTAIQQSQDLRPIFVGRTWYPRDTFDLIQGHIEASVVSIFRDKTRHAVRQYDTPAEYARLENEIRRNCTGRRQSRRTSVRRAR